MNNQPLRSLGMRLLMGGLLVASLTGCAARRLSAAGAASQPTAASLTPGNTTASLADQIAAELDQMDAELNNADILNDFSTALPPDTATVADTATPASGGATATGTPAASGSTTAAPTAAPQATTAPSGADPGAQIDQLLSALQTMLNHTDTVPEAANP